MRPQKYVIPPVDALAIVEAKLLQPAGLDLNQLDRALGALLTRQLDFGDLYFQFTRFETWILEDGIVKDGVHSVDQGVGVRAVSGEKTGFAYADQLDAPALQDAVEAARGIVRTRGDGRVKVPRATPTQNLYPADDPSLSLDDTAKVELLLRLDRETRAMDERVIQVLGSLASVYEMILVLGSDGVLGADIRPLVRLNVSVITQKGDRREQGYAGCGGRGDLSLLTAPDRVRSLAAEAVRQASVN
ncbi:MAG: metalloprotease TldD, partial [Gammaproteobacteria bacterium]|nr:metalloprotease TldD [Gammaproteobacteria bacterium]